MFDYKDYSKREMVIYLVVALSYRYRNGIPIKAELHTVSGDIIKVDNAQDLYEKAYCEDGSIIEDDDQIVDHFLELDEIIDQDSNGFYPTFLNLDELKALSNDKVIYIN